MIFKDGGVLIEDTSRGEIIISEYPLEEFSNPLCSITGACYDEVYEWRKRLFFTTGL